MAELGIQSGGNRQRAALYLILGAALAVHVGCFLYVSANPGILFTVDSAEYLRAFDNLLNRGVLYAGNLSKPIIPDFYSWRPPGYPVLLLVSNFLWNDVRSVILVQIFLTLLNAVLLYHLMEALGVTAGIRLFITVLFLFYPTQLIYTQVLMPAVLFQTLLLCVLVFLNRFLQTGRPLDIWLVNVAIGLALLTKPILVFIWVPHLVYSLWLWFRSRQTAVLVAALVPILCILTWSYRNKVQTGFFHYCALTTHMQSYIVGQVGRVRLATRGGPWGDERQAEKFSEEQGETQTEFVKVVLGSPLRLGRRVAIGAGTFFLDPGRFDVYHFLGMRQRGSLSRRLFHPDRLVQGILGIPPPLLVFLAATTLVNVLTLSSLLWWGLARHVRLELRLFLLMLVFYTAVATVGVGRARYRLPVMPYLWLSAAVALSSFGPGRRAESRFDKASEISG